ncbi:hypothetical protein GLE_3989 [Lysobacter enzymogenes]|uniref:Uncharacterized protein n=1 Tax=Lysobacter enzymogenes TaxID=69 RepID=A0A0S2DLE1_LYSEN|nr:hypothetical protein GLE_3989 [Lysobacter enzymogenes]
MEPARIGLSHPDVRSVSATYAANPGLGAAAGTARGRSRAVDRTAAAAQAARRRRLTA